MLRATTLLIPVLCVFVGACTVIKINPGDTQTIDFEGDADVARDLTTRACRRARQQSAEIVSIENKDPARPPGTGRQRATFRCLSGAPPKQS
jgi:hypothetical protein